MRGLLLYLREDMWVKLSNIILRNRIAFLISLGLITLFFGWRASQIELSYSYARALPAEDTANIDYEKFRQLYGEDGNVMVLGFSDKDLFTLKKFNAWYDLGQEIKSIVGIKDVLSACTLYNIKRNDSLSRFDFYSLLKEKPHTQTELDSIHKAIKSLPFYEGLIFNSDSHATLMAITFDKEHLNSKDRITISESIKKLGDTFATENNIELHYSGMPYIRTVFMKKVSSEMILFLLLAIVITSVILFLFFRSYYAVIFLFLFALSV